MTTIFICRNCIVYKVKKKYLQASQSLSADENGGSLGKWLIVGLGQKKKMQDELRASYSGRREERRRKQEAEEEEGGKEVGRGRRGREGAAA